MTASASVAHLETSTAIGRLAVPFSGAIFVLGVGASLGSLHGGLVHPGWYVAFSITNVAAFTVAGLLWLRLRPSNRVGIVLLALAGICAVQAFEGSSSAVPFSIAVLFDPLIVLVWTYLVVIFPGSKVQWRESGVLAFAVGVIVVGFVPWFFFTPYIAGGTPLARCTAACPHNALMIVNRPGLAAHFARAEEVGRVLFAVFFIALLVGRLIAATGPGRRILVPIYAVAVAWAATFGVYGIVENLLPTNMQVRVDLGWMLTGMRVALPLAFAVAIVSARSFAGVALGSMMAQLRHLGTAGDLQRVAGDALGDSSLRLAVWNAGSAEWVGVDGAVTRPPAAGSGRSWREISGASGRARAALAYDRALDETPELVEAAASAVKLSLDARWLESELRQSHEDLGDSQRRSATIVAEQRQKFERDLHDSVQQRLVVVGMDLGRLRSEADSVSTAEELERLRAQVELALVEIRDVARGQLPPALNDLGLHAALAAAVRGNPRVILRVGTFRRPAQAVEIAVYFSVLEAIQNATKHGGPATRINASVWSGVRELNFQVADDGRGFDTAAVSAHGGMAGLSRRLRSVGGSLDITSMPGAGTTIVGRVPTG